MSAPHNNNESVASETRSSLPSFQQSPVSFLNAIAKRPPSKDLLLHHLADHAVTEAIQQDANTTALVVPYLKAVARHLPTVVLDDNNVNSAAAAAAGASGPTVRTRTSMEIESSQHLSFLLTVSTVSAILLLLFHGAALFLCI